MRADTYLVELNVPPYPVPIQKQNKANLRPTDKAVEVLMDGVNLLSVPITNISNNYIIEARNILECSGPAFRLASG